MHTFALHLEHPQGRRHNPAGAFTGAAGGAACGDLVRVSVAVEDGERVTDAGFDVAGCGAAIAAGSAAVSLVRGAGLLEAARVGAEEITAELGGLSPGKRHAAELAADALARALGQAARARATLAPAGGRVLVAMSGGVDSAVAALLSARTGAEVAAVTLELWSDPENDGERSCCSAQAVRRARALAHQMGLAHLTLDLREEFRAGVVEPWLADHAAGLTPNPCVRCNGSVRLDAMLELGQRLGAATLATGHYARVADGGSHSDGADVEPPLLRVAADPAKDQSYMLAALPPASLARMHFPLGDLEKVQVRRIAEQAGLPVARAPDSQDLCFLAGTGRAAFLARHGGLGDRPGAIVDGGGRPLGRHRGQHGFTVGQRRGLGVGGGEALYVLATDAGTNTVTVGRREELRADRVRLRELALHRAGARVDRVKLRYRSRPLACRLPGDLHPGRHAQAEVALSEPVYGAAPGQLAALMEGELVIGHATIDR
jgi:tRNA-specific 2-thiouridylase